MRLRTALLLSLLTLAGGSSLALADEVAPDPVHAYLAKVHQGLEKISAGAYDEALDLLRRAKQDQPSKPHAIYYEAVAMKLKGDVEGAIQTFRNARVVASHSGDAGYFA